MADGNWRPRLRWTTALPGLVPSAAVRRHAQEPFGLVAPFLRLALLISLTTGFGLGAALALGEATDAPLGTWWETLVQAHGLAQLLGFVGLFILAVATHYLPRLRGAPLAQPALARWGLLGIGTGAVVQPLAQVVAVAAAGPLAAAARGGLALGALLAWLGATVLLGSLIQTLRLGPPLGWRGGLLAILPYLVTGLTTLWVALLADLYLSVVAAVSPTATVPTIGADAVVDALLFGFALPIALGVSARVLPIFLGVEVVTPGPLLAVAAAVAGGLVLRLAGDLSGGEGVEGVGNLLLGLACLVFPIASGVPIGVRRAIRRADPPELARAARLPNLLLRSAYAWLLLAALLLLTDGLTRLALGHALWPDDAVRHTLGAGYLTLLIFGAGARLLPGFARQRLQPAPALGGVLIAANLAAVLRVLPPLANAAGLSGLALDGAFGASGVCALVGVALFTWHAWPMLAG